MEIGTYECKQLFILVSAVVILVLMFMSYIINDWVGFFQTEQDEIRPCA